ncbi:MAG: VOC family protein, partial [Candidatus Acidiferrales bacterium]
SLTIEVKDVAEAERVFAAFAENAKVQMPLQETFWATRFGMLVDRFGIPWMINCGKASQQAA